MVISLSHLTMRKRIKYDDLLNELSNKNYTAKLLTVELGSRGLPNVPDFIKLKECIGLTKRQINQLMTNTAKVAIEESYFIWKERNNNKR